MGQDSINTASIPDEPRGPLSGVSAGPRERPGDVLGAFTLITLLGEGGFGSVWLAERKEPMVQRVALKIIKPGMDSEAVIARFEQERQALAVMDHPNVARVFDGGMTPMGRPYFVMELVQGEPITRFCDRHKLPLRQRLALFILVCKAIQHAHGKGIIHRDLKPSNILVAIRDKQAVPKVIDFGIAKAISHTLTEKTIFTAQGTVIGTPEYMSPEQAEGLPTVDTRTDVYSLGAILYELLTGMLPFDSGRLRSAGLVETLKIIRDVEPPSPSSRVSRLRERAAKHAGAPAEEASLIAASRKTTLDDLAADLRRELEWIPLKAMRKDPAARYASAQELGEDVQRYLKAQALDAGPESSTYRARKYLRKHRGPTIAMAGIVLALVAGGVATLLQARRAAELESQKLSAEAERRQMADSASSSKKEVLQARSVIAEAEAENERLAREAAEALRAAQAAASQRPLAESSGASDAPAPGAGSQDNPAKAAPTVRVRARPVALTEYLTQWTELRRAYENDAAPTKVDDLLRRCDSGQRGWEWWWVNAWADQSLRCVVGTAQNSKAAEVPQDGPLLSAAFDSPGGRILTLSERGSIARITDITTGRSVVLAAQGRTILSAVLSADGTQVASVGGDNVDLWNASTGAHVTSWPTINYPAPAAIAISHDAKHVVTTSGKKGAVWNTQSQTLVANLSGHLKNVVSAEYSPDDKFLLTASEDTFAGVWDSYSGKALFAARKHRGPLKSAEYSPDGARIVTASTDHSARVWDSTGSKELFAMISHTDAVNFAAFGPLGARIVTACQDGRVRVFDGGSGKELAVLRGHLGGVRTARFSPDGRLILSASKDGTARLWEAEPANLAPVTIASQDPVRAVAFLGDDNVLVTGADDTTARVWDSVNGGELHVLRGHRAPVLCVAASRDGSMIATASADAGVYLWNAATGAKLREFKGHEQGVVSLAFNKDASRLVTGSGDRTARLWDVASGRPLLTFSHDAGVRSVAFSPDGLRIVTGSDDQIARVWDVSTGAELLSIQGHQGPVVAAAFSPDGAWIVTASADRSARVWDAGSGVELQRLVGHVAALTDASFSPDGSRVLTASVDGSVRLWEPWGGTELLALREQAGPILAARFGPDGVCIATVGADKTVRVWNSAPQRVRAAQRAAIQRQEDRGAPMRDWLRDSRAGQH